MAGNIIDLRLFRYALASAEYGSFRRAAAALNVQQSSVSRGVRSLEYQLCAPLFERSHAGVRPTPAGKRFLQEANQGFDHLDRAMQRIGAVQRGAHGELTIAASVPFRLLGDVLERFRDAHQGVSVEMVEGTCSSSLTLIQQREADIAFVTKASGDGMSQSLHLRNEHLMVLVPKSHQLAQSRALTLEELRSEKLIFSATGMGPKVGEYVVQRMAKSGIEPDLQLHRVGLCDLINMVARGFGVTIVVGQLPWAAPEEVVLIPLAGRSAISIHAVWVESNSNPAKNGLLNILRKAATPCQPA